jgi:hypothetical protein
MQGCDNAFQNREGIARAIGVALLEINAILAHRIGDVRQTKK